MNTAITEKEMTATENDVSKLSFFDDLYVVDASRSFAVSVGRSAERRFLTGEDIRVSLEPSEVEALREYLMSFDVKPLPLTTSDGRAFVYGSAFPSTILFLLSFPRGIGGVEKSCRQIEEVFGRDEEALVVLGERAESVLSHTVLATASLAGCRVSLRCEKSISLGYGFDKYIFKMFLLIFFMSAREYGTKREARVELKNSYEGAFVTAEFSVYPDEGHKSTYPLSTILSLAERHNIRCTMAFRDGIARAEICPVRKDWSLLGLKRPMGFDWNS